MANSTKHKIRSKRSYHNYKAFDMFSRNAEVAAILKELSLIRVRIN